ncbi:MAG: ABC transporter substrate-binding protein, partial [Actinomadura sp.]
MREPPPSAGEGGESLLQLFERWTGRLGTTQAPSQHVAHPWLLRLPIRHEPADEGPDPALAYRHRPRWTWVWSLRGFAATVVVLTLVAGYAHKHLRATYCRVGIIPVSWNSDTRWRTGADRECIGVATGGVRFESGPDSIGLDGDLRAPDPNHRGDQITLADLQDKIEMANADVLDSRRPYVTVLYAGILTGAADRRDLAVDGLKELAGAYLAQMRNNGLSQPGQIGSPLQIRLLPVNVGKDMVFSVDAADRVLDIARRDRSVVGVVGMARNTENSQAAIRRLNAAGLPVISTLNSSDELPALPHYYGLAATDHDETAALRPAVERELGRRRVDHAMIVSREPGPSRDVYGREIAADAERALDPRQTEHVRYVDTDDVSDRVKAACESAAARPYTLVYFAGRREDVRGLMDGLSKGGCTRRGLVLLAGDEVATVRFGTEEHEVPLPASITLYYTAFAYLPNLISDHRDQEHAFFLLARNLLGIGAPRARGDEPLFVDGQMALAYDGTSALAEASHNVFDTFGLTRGTAVQVPGSGAVTSGAVLLELSRLRWPDGATGAVVFSDTGNARQHARNGPGNRGLTVVRVALENGEPVSGAICGRLNGGRPVPGLPTCPR